MALLHSFESSGNFLFRNRGQIPVFLFIIAIPVIYITDISYLSPTWEFLIQMFAVSISFAGLLIRAITIGTTPAGTSGRNTREGQVANELNTTGIYSIIRHPLYLGNFLMWIGIVFFTYNLYFVIIVSLGYWLYYERIMFAEERFLEKKFGDIYMDWSLQAPAFIPSFGHFIKGNMPFSFKSVLRREYSGFLATVFGFVFIDNMRQLFTYNTFNIFRASNIALFVTLIIVLILRTLKHRTSILNEIDRS